MVKSILKETFIMLLLCVAIVLLLGILFYNYIPSNRVVPEKKEYVSSEKVKAELEETINNVENDKQPIVYKITDSDLEKYKQTSSYRPGKKDPFSSLEEKSENVGNNGGNNTGNTNDNNTQNSEPKNETPTKDKNSTGTFFNDEGIK